MAIRVKLPTGEIGEFPDDMSHEDIESVLQKQFPPEQATTEEEAQEQSHREERTGLLGVAGDVAHGLENAKKFALDIPNKLKKSGKYIEENPGKSILHNAGQVAAGTAETGKSILNAPHDLLKYFIKKHLAVDIPIPGTNWHTSDLIPHIPEDTGVEKALGLEADKMKGDELFRSIPDIVGMGAGGASVAKGVKNLATAPSKEKLFKRALESKIDKAAEEKGLASGELDNLKDSLRQEYSRIHGERVGELTPTGQQVEINIKKNALENNPKKNEVPEGELPEIPEKPDTKTMLEEHKKAIDEAKESAEKGLNILDNPSLKAGSKVKNAIIDVKDKASSLYKAARKHYSDKKIIADNSKEIKAATEELEALKDADELAPGYGSGTAKQKELEANIQALKGEKVNASDIFDLQRTLEKMAENTRKSQYESGTGKTDLERKRLGEQAQKLDAHAEKLAKRLESVGGKDVQNMISGANKGWKVYKELSQGKYENGVFKSNPVGKAALKSGSVPNNALIELAKDHPSNDFLKGLVDSDSELRKHLLAAYSGEKNVNKLLKPSTVIKKYVESLPEVDEKLNAFKNAVADYKSGEKSAEKINKAHDALVKSMKEVAEAKQLQQQIKSHEEAIPKIKAKMDKVDAKSSEHAKLVKELKDHEKHLSDKNHLLKKYGKAVIGFLGVHELTKKLGF